ncbi:MAG: UbiH/UbiF/VisC/COQ6 family ubiquinone biosynthesis hydroxylase [Spongiibacteraceae bacterium]|jgi:2-octaprenylphenol hydroxylase|nr:UbiH/UbiF/VisC/COQ6 family ubiquinone biosynthesis hydroxylase [Spongiibacteraceae bacterium]
MIGGRYDIVIVGAGLAGAGLAAALDGSGWRVALLEARPLRSGWPPLEDSVDGFDTRVCALNAASQGFLDSVGAWPAIAERRLCPYRQMEVWDAEGTGRVVFDSAVVNRDALGHIVENRLVNAALLNRLDDSANVQRFSPVTVQGFTRRDGRVHLQLAEGGEASAALLVAADGGASPLRRLAGLRTREWDYGQHAVVATVRTTLPHRHTARQRFLRSGPLAFLPLPGDGDRRCSIVWSTSPEHAEQLLALDDAGFSRALAEAFEYTLGDITAVGRRQSLALRQCHAVDYVQPGFALVGDAAHSIHPLAGQGINLGFRDVAVLAEELRRAQRRELAAGDLDVLLRYQRRRKAHNLATMAAMEGFKRLFARTGLPLRLARNHGMRWVDGQLPVKRRLIRAAMGI